jgi:hypothetical protein
MITVKARFHAALIVSLAVLPRPAMGTVTVYTVKSAWQNAVGDYSTIDFTGYPNGTWLDEQYADLGVHFTDGSDQFYQNNGFLQDGWGLNGALDDSTLEFDAPITTIAMDFPGKVRVKLFSNGELIYTSIIMGNMALGNFRGLVSTEPFDTVMLHDGGLFIDNIYFDPPIPAPPTLALALFGVATLLGQRRRRRSDQTSIGHL